MEVSIKECPSCGAVVMGDEQVCSGCGKELPAAIEARHRAVRDVAQNERLMGPAQEPAELARPRFARRQERAVEVRCRIGKMIGGPHAPQDGGRRRP